MVAEIQANTPEMIFAKEKEVDARKLLGDEVYDSIAQEKGVSGGRGHELYEKARMLPSDSPEYQDYAHQSREYYQNFR